MGKYVSWEEQLRRRKEWRNKHEETRKSNAKTWKTMSKAKIAEARRLLKNCGLTQIQISDFSGVGAGSVSRFLNRRNSPKIEFGTMVAYLGAAGYRIKFEKVPDESDQFRKARRLPPGSDY